MPPLLQCLCGFPHGLHQESLDRSLYLTAINATLTDTPRLYYFPLTFHCAWDREQDIKDSHLSQLIADHGNPGVVRYSLG